MAALTTMLAVGLAGLGTVNQVAQQKKAEKNAAAAAAAAETKALEAAKLKGPREQDLKIKIGSAGADALPEGASTDVKGTSKTNTGSAKRVSQALGVSASRVGGL